MGQTSSSLLALQPVTFKYRQEPVAGEQPVQFGLIAEDVAEVFPELVIYDRDGQPETVKYHLLSSLLLNELQRQNRWIRVQGWLLGVVLLAGAGVTVGRWRLG